MALLQQLGCLDRTGDFPLAQPDTAIEPDAARNDVDVVVLRVVVSDNDVGMLIGKPHFPHEVGGHLVPLFGGQTLPWRQSQRAVPQVPLDVLANSPDRRQLPSHLCCRRTGQTPADDLGPLQPCRLPALIEQVAHQASGPAPSSDSRLHASPSSISSVSGSSWSCTPSKSRRSACTCSRSSATSAGGMPWAWPCSIATW